MVIFTISGYIGSGKDTCANYLVEHHGFHKIAFADALKDVVATAFGWERSMLEGDTKASREARNVVDERWSKALSIPNFTPRKALQFIGTNIFKTHVSSSFWIEKLRMRLENCGYERIIVTDCRYHDEFDALVSLGAQSINVIRGEPPEYSKFSSIRNPLVKPLANLIMKTRYNHIHTSEWMWNDLVFDHTVDNNGSMESTFDQLNKIMDPV